MTNPTAQPTPPTAIPELFPQGAQRAGRLVFSGPAGAIAPQADGSSLLRFAVPELQPGAHHILEFTLKLAPTADPRARLAQLSRARDEAVARHALLRSDAPTLSALVIGAPTSALAIGQQLTLDVGGRLASGDVAPPNLLDGLRWTVVEGANVVEVLDGVVIARRPGPAIISAAVGAVEARLAVTVLAPPAKPTTTRPRRARTTTPPPTFIIEEQEAPPPHESFLVLGPSGRSGRSGPSA